MVHICIPPIIWMYFWWRPFFFGLHAIWGKKRVLFLMKTFLYIFWSSPEFGEKSDPFAYFFWSSQNFHTWTKSWSGFIPPMLKMGQNWGKIANFPPQCSTKIVTSTYNIIVQNHYWNNLHCKVCSKSFIVLLKDRAYFVCWRTNKKIAILAQTQP